MNKKSTVWKISAKRADFYELAKKLSIDPVTARIIRNRDVTEEKDFKRFLKPEFKDIYSSDLLKDMDVAVSKVMEAIEKKTKIRIVGDYDTDGTCATFILCSGLNRLNSYVDYYIPDRKADGYGINAEIIKRSKEDGVELIITCDNGIAAIEELEYAERLGIDVIVTDHHQLVKNEVEKNRVILPKALAVINPHRPDCDYPFKHICGANIAFKLIQALYQRLGMEDRELDELRFFASIATIGDMMPLIDENRVLVKWALLNFFCCKNIGLTVLCNKLNIDHRRMRAYDVGFKISPCINAGGRLDTARLVLKLFFSQTEEEAAVITDELIELNNKRKEMTLEQSQKAFDIIDTLDEELKVIVVYLPDCHESIAGIVASRIKDRYHRPAFVVTKGKEGLKGSARSIAAYSMYEEMSKCKELFTRFGGHKMAAGFSLTEDKLADLCFQLNDNCSLSEKEITEEIILDMELPLEYLNISLVKEFELLEPFGMGNNKPLFGVKQVGVSSMRTIGKENEYLKLIVHNGKGFKLEALCFDKADELKEALFEKCKVEDIETLLKSRELYGLRLSLIYYPAINSFMGRESVQIFIHDFILC